MRRSPHERRRPMVTCLVGFPGMGKTTQAETVAAALGVPRLRLGRFLKDHGTQKTPKELVNPLDWYRRLLEHTDRYLREGVMPIMHEFGVTVLDGFPRGPTEVEELHACAEREGWAVNTLAFTMPAVEDCIAFSRERQRSRAVKLGRPLNDAWYDQKIELARLYEMVALDRARELGMRITTIDPRAPTSIVTQTVRRALRLDFERLPWDWEVLELLHEVAPDAFVVGGAFYRPFWNGVFGPLQKPWNIGVAVDSDARATAVAEVLERRAASYRWRVGNAARFMEERLGVAVECVSDALRLSHNLVGLSGGVRLRAPGRLQLVFAPDAESHLRRGVLQPSARAEINDAAAKARALVQDYPGLGASFINHAPGDVIPDWSTIHAETVAMEQGGRRLWDGLSAEEAALADGLRVFAVSSEKRPSAPPVPPKAVLPAGDPWNAPDAAFREWLLYELRAPLPSPSRDKTLEIGLMIQFGAPQKPTHQGWATHQHAAQTLLLLETDRLPPRVRRAMRVATLFHDLGKLWNIRTPGAHGKIGATKWPAYAPKWLTDDERGLAQWLIGHHDLLGRLARGVKEPEFGGALDPAHISGMLAESGLPHTEALELVAAMNRADIGSVASLRWTLPELDFAVQMVRTRLAAASARQS